MYVAERFFEVHGKYTKRSIWNLFTKKYCVYCRDSVDGNYCYIIIPKEIYNTIPLWNSPDNIQKLGIMSKVFSMDDVSWFLSEEEAMDDYDNKRTAKKGQNSQELLNQQELLKENIPLTPKEKWNNFYSLDYK